jgi:hypothetical protein
MYNQEWEIKPRAIACKTCQQPFSDGQIYVSSLRLNGPEYERTDCCENCWKQDAVSGAFSVWRGNFQAAPPPPPEVLKKETAESLLRKLIEKNEPEYRNVIFILAVMLERRRILSEKEVQKKDDNVMIRVYEHRKTGETFIVSDPMLRLDQLGHVQEEVAALLSGQDAISVADE